MAFYRTVYPGDPAKAVSLYVGAEHVQHNPQVGDGKQAFLDCFSEMARGYHEKSIGFVRAVVAGDLVALHTHQTWSGNEQYVTMVLFRFAGEGKIVDHRDAIRAVPEESRNGNHVY